MRFEYWHARFEQELSKYTDEYPAIVSAGATEDYLDNKMYLRVSPKIAAQEFVKDFIKNLNDFKLEKEFFS